VPGLVYDTGALLAAERADLRVVLLHRGAQQTGHQPVVPAVVLAQAWRGGAQARLARFLQGCLVMAFDERVARAAGAACAAARTSDVVDATVVVVAATLRATVVTSDAGDIEDLADALGVKIAIEAV
jgi:predicted nucleic acid-binding protein